MGWITAGLNMTSGPRQYTHDKRQSTWSCTCPCTFLWWRGQETFVTAASVDLIKNSPVCAICIQSCGIPVAIVCLHADAVSVAVLGPLGAHSGCMIRACGSSGGSQVTGVCSWLVAPTLLQAASPWPAVQIVLTLPLMCCSHCWSTT